jgi:hypothetical protein
MSEEEKKLEASVQAYKKMNEKLKALKVEKTPLPKKESQ